MFMGPLRSAEKIQRVHEIGWEKNLHFYFHSLELKLSVSFHYDCKEKKKTAPRQQTL